MPSAIVKGRCTTLKTSTLAVLSVLIVEALTVIAPPAHAQLARLPKLGTPVPANLTTANKHEKRCHTSESSYDPCTEIDIDNIRYTIAWDPQTKDITYLFTDDHHLVTDNGLAVGNTIRVIGDSGKPDPTVPYMKWVIDPKWKDKATKFGQQSLWFAALRKNNFDTSYDNIAGFVQSRYLQLKPYQAAQQQVKP
jgi:hypothetical protein